MGGYLEHRIKSVLRESSILHMLTQNTYKAIKTVMFDVGCCAKSLHNVVLSWFHDRVEPSETAVPSGQFQLDGEVRRVHIDFPPSGPQVPAYWSANKMIIVHRDATIYSKTVFRTVLTLGQVKVHQP